MQSARDRRRRRQSRPTWVRSSATPQRSGGTACCSTTRAPTRSPGARCGSRWERRSRSPTPAAGAWSTSYAESTGLTLYALDTRPCRRSTSGTIGTTGETSRRGVVIGSERAGLSRRDARDRDPGPHPDGARRRLAQRRRSGRRGVLRARLSPRSAAPTRRRRTRSPTPTGSTARPRSRRATPHSATNARLAPVERRGRHERIERVLEADHERLEREDVADASRATAADPRSG